jgi:hypothetical protein
MKNIFLCHDHHGVARNLPGILDAVQKLWKLNTFTNKRLLLIYSYEPNNALNEIRFMTHINLLYVSAPGCHSKEGFPIKRVEDQYTNLVMHGTNWND